MVHCPSGAGVGAVGRDGRRRAQQHPVRRAGVGRIAVQRGIEANDGVGLGRAVERRLRIVGGVIDEGGRKNWSPARIAPPREDFPSRARWACSEGYWRRHRIDGESARLRLRSPNPPSCGLAGSMNWTPRGEVVQAVGQTIGALACRWSTGKGGGRPRTGCAKPMNVGSFGSSVWSAAAAGGAVAAVVHGDAIAGRGGRDRGRRIEGNGNRRRSLMGCRPSGCPADRSTAAALSSRR